MDKLGFSVRQIHESLSAPALMLQLLLLDHSARPPSPSAKSVLIFLVRQSTSAAPRAAMAGNGTSHVGKRHPPSDHGMARQIRKMSGALNGSTSRPRHLGVHFAGLWTVEFAVF